MELAYIKNCIDIHNDLYKFYGCLQSHGAINVTLIVQPNNKLYFYVIYKKRLEA